MTPRIAVLACVAALFAASLASAEPPTIYKWVDENGVAHYTTDRGRIPSDIGTRVERAPSVVAPAPAVHQEDEMRDAVRVRPQQGVAATEPVPPTPPPTPGPASAPIPAPTPPLAAPAPTIVAPAPAPDPAPAPVASDPEASKPVAAAMPAEVFDDMPAPLAADAPEPVDPVAPPPPAPIAPLEPKQSAELAKLDSEIEVLESQIADREEKLAALISTVDDQRSTPLVDDPKFREISQNLPKLQAELQTLRERRNKIQPSATP